MQRNIFTRHAENKSINFRDIPTDYKSFRFNLLLSQNVYIRLDSILSYPILAWACLTSDEDLVKAVLSSNDIDVNAASNDGSTAMHLSCFSREINILKLLLADPRVNIEKEIQKLNVYISSHKSHEEEYSEVLSLLNAALKSRQPENDTEQTSLSKTRTLDAENDWVHLMP